MTSDELKQRLQAHFTDHLVTIVGSGLSAAAGLPTMGQLADHLKTEIPKRVGPSLLPQWSDVEKQLIAGNDLETALRKVEFEDELVDIIVNCSAALITERERIAIQEIVLGTRELPFTGLLRHLVFANGRAEVITPNYDRLIEFATELAGYGVDTTFAGTVFGKFDPKLSRDALSEIKLGPSKQQPVRRTFRNHIVVYKPHGSIDWYVRNGEPIRCWEQLDAPRLMITPGASKFRKGYDSPFDYHREQANAAIDSASGYIVLGYGFNDDQLETHLRRRLEMGYPCLIMTLGLTPNAVQVLTRYPATFALVRGDQLGTEGTTFHAGKKEEFFPGLNIWRLDAFVKEVLGA